LKNKIFVIPRASRGIHLDAATARSMTRKGAFLSGTGNIVAWQTLKQKNLAKSTLICYG
jgi:hypothetical protein